MKTPGSGARSAAAGLALGAAGMLYRRLGGRRAAKPAAPARSPQPRSEPAEHAPDASPAEVERAKSELADELARRAARSSD